MRRFSAKWRPRSPKSSASKAVSHTYTHWLPNSLKLSQLTVFDVEYRKVIVSKQKMAEKKSENEMVMTEFKMLDDEAVVYKMVGPVLAKQSLFECKDLVQQRITFIDKEIARFETLETEF